MTETKEDNSLLHIELRPFKHQVGGHMCVLEVGRSVICKPYADQEVWFYQHAPEKLKYFIPRYIGETDVTCDLTQQRKCLVASVPVSVAEREGLFEGWLNGHVTGDDCPRKRRKKSKDIKENKHKETKDNLTSWSNACFDRQINQYGFWTNNQPQKFIMLENLVAGHKKPCLMDLKMGRRQFGGDSDEGKRKLLESRCAGSTSSTLGFRLCGSQSFKVNTGTYTFHDKYHGRSLNDAGAKEEILQFFHNGTCLRRDVLSQMLEKLRQLQNIIESDRTLLFHAASLLLIYDGGLPSNHDRTNYLNIEQQPDHNLNVSHQTQPYTTPCIKEPLVRPCEEPSPSVSYDNTGENEMPSYSPKGTNDLTEVHESHNRPQTNNITVDVRLIDFAHVSEAQTWVKDESIVFGLVKLQELFAKLLEGDIGVMSA